MRLPGDSKIHCASRSTRAFTLLELLIATAIFAVVLLAINTVFFAGLTLQRRATSALDDSLPVQNALAMLRHDLQNTVNPGGVLAGHFRMGGPASALNSGAATVSGTADASTQTGATATGASTASASGQTGGLDFFTTTGVLRDHTQGADIVEVNYQLKDPLEKTDKTWGLDLVRSVTPNLLATSTLESEEQRLLQNVESLEFEFYDGSDWQDTWDTSEGTPLPQAVRANLLMATDPARAVSVREPIRLVVRLNSIPASTNDTSTAAEPGGDS